MEEDNNEKSLVRPVWLWALKMYDNSAWAAFVDRFTPFVRRRAKYLVGLQFADECTANTFQYLLRKIQEARYITWGFLSNAVFYVSSQYRRHRSHADLEPLLAVLAEQSGTSPQAKLEEREEREKREKAVRRALDSMDERQREIVVLRFWQDMTYDEISRVLQITRDQVRHGLRKALDHLRFELRQIGERWA